MDQSLNDNLLNFISWQTKDSFHYHPNCSYSTWDKNWFRKKVDIIWLECYWAAKSLWTSSLNIEKKINIYLLDFVFLTFGRWSLWWISALEGLKDAFQNMNLIIHILKYESIFNDNAESKPTPWNQNSCCR